jgi:2'-5' RNA ligase
MNRVRLFVGSPVEGAVQGILTRFWAENARNYEIFSRSLAWTSSEKFHLTWHFVGDFPEFECEAAKVRLLQAVQVCPRISIRFDDLALWPSANRPQVVVWSGTALQESQFKVSQLLEAIHRCFPNHPPTHKVFRPHITLGRIRKKGPSPQGERFIRLAKASFPPQVWEPSHVHLYKSILLPEGAVHQTLLRVPLEKVPC